MKTGVYPGSTHSAMSHEGRDHPQAHGGAWRMYGRFAAMVAASTIAMYILMYLNTEWIGDVRFSETRMYMALVMGSVMGALMLAFMRGMYTSRTVNATLFALFAAIFVAALWLVRSQATVDDVSYMKAMIPHHSIAILTSTRAQITDPRVRELAEHIATSQRREIEEMDNLIRDLEAQGR